MKTKSNNPIIKIYEICNTDEFSHLNGQIIIADRRPNRSFVTLMVYQEHAQTNDTLHVTSEEISLVTVKNEHEDEVEIEVWHAEHIKENGKNKIGYLPKSQTRLAVD